MLKHIGLVGQVTLTTCNRWQIKKMNKKLLKNEQEKFPTMTSRHSGFKNVQLEPPECDLICFVKFKNEVISLQKIHSEW